MEKNERYCSIDLLRILVSIGVILLHINNADDGNALGIAIDNSKQTLWTALMIIEVLAICSVNVFIITSGFFLSINDTRKYSKIAHMFIMCSLIKILCGILGGSIWVGGDVKQWIYRIVPSNYYITLYAVLYVISPLINKALKQYDNKQLIQKVVELLFIFSGVPTILAIVNELTGKYFYGLCTIGNGGSQSGYTIVNFSLMYCLGYIIRMRDGNERKRLITTALSYFVIVSILCLWEFTYYKKFGNMWSDALSYCNFFVVIESALLFLFFLKCKDVKIFKNKFVCWIITDFAKASLVSYLLHPFIIKYLPISYVIKNTTAINAFCLILIGSVLTYFSCYVVYRVFYTVWHLFSSITMKMFR